VTEPDTDRFPVVVWDTATGSEVDRCSLQSRAGQTVLLTRSGTVLDWNSPRVVSPNGELRAESGVLSGNRVERERDRFTFLGNVYAFSLDSRRLAVASSGQVKILDVDSGLELLTLQGGSQEITSLAFASPGRLLAGYADGRIETWDGSDSDSEEHADTIKF
jgi:WD40 repeat protein